MTWLKLGPQLATTGKINLVVGQSLPLSISSSPSLLAAAVGDNGEDRFGGGSPSISSSFSLLAMAVVGDKEED
ncbi:hypothetical protein Q3G72_034922 [Acer saccharum]|nr:hypothetical protein Q3G72_034922 [Acer saccharum]